MPARIRKRLEARCTLLVLIAVVMPLVVLLSSSVGSAATKAAPANTALPAITGTAHAGQTLSTSNGTWDGSPTSFNYQWVRCPASGGQPDGSDCAVISGATASNYLVAAGDIGFRLRVRVTAINSDGQATVASSATDVVAPAAGPPNTAPPTISGTTTVGSTLTASPGTWTGSSVTFTYQWQRCDTGGANCATISGATSTTYALVNADASHTLRVAVTGTDATGPNTVTSAQTATVTQTAPPPSSTGCPSDKATSPINVSEVSPPAHLLIDRQAIAPSPVASDTKTVVFRFHVSACSGRSIVGALVYQTPTPYQQFSASEVATGPDGWATITANRLRFFPASPRQQLLVVFVRARKPGEDLLGGISARRLVSFKVNLHS